MTDIESTNAAVARRLYEEVLNRQNTALLPELLAPDVLFHGASEEQGIAAYQALVARLRVAFPDQRFTIEDTIASGDRVVVRWNMEATHSGPLAGIPATGKRVTQRAIVIYRFKDGKVAEAWALMDQVGMLRQLGRDPLPAANRSGQAAQGAQG
ncbi:MAG TPA: ester cyclase [Acidobacteriaceae bacterium]|jgi:steroid delta-isomerase-like uncharacterized protein